MERYHLLSSFWCFNKQIRFLICFKRKEIESTQLFTTAKGESNPNVHPQMNEYTAFDIYSQCVITQP